ncbi:CotH kinase family protein [Streptomyces hirsutus]|uniref:CotH kinase family protein n=1 Tax=Streptomyces hirsutus TaxID=35620 RepID=A0ABZ1GPI8_9ACTN|nr:CotH kinase family protein [Streptomyces hirsutus]WSD07191.1 CotH kinase family protein [Streptomyces hirsutus]
MSGETTVQRKRRLRDRLPVRLRHHWKPAATLGVGLAAMVYFLGDVRISPYVTSSSRVEADAITDDVEGTVDLYDTSVAHSIQLTYEQTDFDKMMKEFKEDGTKDYIEADLVIDGVHLNDVGIRLKGNSTLSSLRGNKGMPGGGRALPDAAQGAPAGADGAAGGRDRGQGRTAGGGPGGADGMGGMGGMVQYNLSAEKPEELPWLVKIDEYVEGRAYQGEREISLRPGSNGQVPLNEALSLSLTKESGQKAERYGFTELKVNNRPSATRLMVEAPDTDYADDVADGNGVLYKAKASGSFEYQGDDPTEYESSFKQLNKKGSQDLEPVMKLIKWVNSASDEEFARDLDQYVDVDSLAAYLAAQNLLLNFDDMAGPGKNYLLWYDLDTRKFSVLGWDYNLTFSGDAAAGPDDSVGMGGGMPGGNAGAGGGGGGDNGATGGNNAQQPPAGGTMPSGAPQDLPSGMPEGLPEGFPEELPEGLPEELPEGLPGGAAGGGQDGGTDEAIPGPGGGADAEGGRGGFMQHVLKTKFLESDAFDDVYKKAYRELYQTFYGSGTAAKELKTIAEQARSAKADSKELDTAVTELTKTVTDRTTALAEDKEVTG